MIKIFEMFAGYGGASFALNKAGIEHEVVGYSEIDKYAIQCYDQNHKGKNFGDCTKINPNELPDFDLLTGGFPCQSFSVAGKGLGEQDTRGTLFHEIIRIVEVKKPYFMLLENVKGLTFKPHEQTFKKILSELDRIGYVVKWKVLNSKDYGIPQNRERVFFVCFRNDLLTSEFNWRFDFPQKEELKIFLKDILEEQVDEKYFLSEKQINKLKEYLGKKNKINEEVINCVGTCFGRSGSSSEELESFSRTNKALMIGNLSRYKMKSERTIEFKEDGVSWGLTGNCGVGIIEPIMVDVSQLKREGNPRIYKKVSKTLNTAQGGGHTPLILDIYNNNLKEDVCPTITEPHHNNLRILFQYRLRKLTPKECFKLMGFLDDGINLDNLSDTQRYKLAGNGWDINLVSKIFKNMLGDLKNNIESQNNTQGNTKCFSLNKD